MLEQMFFPDDVSYWLEGAQWIEVLNKPAPEWIDQFRRALALTGYRITQTIDSTGTIGTGRRNRAATQQSAGGFLTVDWAETGNCGKRWPICRTANS